MTPKKKAKELVEKFQSGYTTKEGFPYQLNIDLADAKQCALIAVDEVLSLVCAIDGTEYWQNYYEQVKTEINNL